LHLFVAGGFAFVAHQAERVVRPVEGFRLAADHFPLRLQLLGEAEQERQRLAHAAGDFRCAVGVHRGVFEPFLRDPGIELVVAQIGNDGHALEARLGGLQRQGGFVKNGVERNRRAIAAFLQGVGLDHMVGQHGDLVARHVDGGHPRARDLVDGTARHQREARRGDVDTDRHRAAAEALHRQRVVDFCRLRIVN
jgi:hypothetical protein